MIKVSIRYILPFFYISIPTSIILLLLLNTVDLDARNNMIIFIMFTYSIIMHLSIIGTIQSSELYESKNNGKKFLETLPISKFEIVSYRFYSVIALFILSLILIYISLSFMWFDYPTRIRFLKLNIIIGLIDVMIAGLLYIGYFSKGNEFMNKILIPLYVILMSLGQIFSLIFIYIKNVITETQFFRILDNINLLFFTLISFIVFLFCFIQTKKIYYK